MILVCVMICNFVICIANLFIWIANQFPAMCSKTANQISKNKMLPGPWDVKYPYKPNHTFYGQK